MNQPVLQPLMVSFRMIVANVLVDSLPEHLGAEEVRRFTDNTDLAMYKRSVNYHPNAILTVAN